MIKKIVFIFIVLFSFAHGIKAQEQEVQTIDTKTSELYIPNAFTPNGDGLNDVFKIYNLTNESVIDFRIFNRWGNIMYRSEDNQAEWDGKSKSTEQPTGVYGYLIKVAYDDGRIVTYKGTLTLIR